MWISPRWRRHSVLGEDSGSSRPGHFGRLQECPQQTELQVFLQVHGRWLRRRQRGDHGRCHQSPLLQRKSRQLVSFTSLIGNAPSIHWSIHSMFHPFNVPSICSTISWFVHPLVLISVGSSAHRYDHQLVRPSISIGSSIHWFVLPLARPSVGSFIR